MKDRTKLIIYEIFGFLLSVIPLILTLILRRNIYFGNTNNGIKLTFGLITALFFFVLKAFESFKIPKLIGCFALIFILSYLLAPLIHDLCLLSGMALLGEFFNLILVSHKVNSLREKIRNDSVSDYVAEKLIHSGYEGSGRI